MNQSKFDLGMGTMDQEVTLACGEQPPARLENFGAAALSDAELLAIVLQNGLTTGKLMDLSQRMIAEAGSLAGFASWHTTDFLRWTGIGKSKGQLLVAIIEISRRAAQPPRIEAPMLNRPELIAEYMASTVRGLEIEKFWVLCLNRKNRLKRMVEITSGTATSSLAHPREVFRCAIREAATAVVCVHNHPSGDPAPSAADVQVTRQLREAAKAIDIELLDHVIVGRASADPTGRGMYSFREAGIL
ncbi:MAG TPA: DNA repair protein RadC [Lacunisphaera sp.]|jgi:DNA repair protein RadC|nr:DNA repair protein RadC [Lacunisphaera sp.]